MTGDQAPLIGGEPVVPTRVDGEQRLMPSGQVVFEQDAEFIAKVLALLNTAPTSENFYLDVRLRLEGQHDVVGEFSDEIAATDWSFTWVVPRP